MGSGSRRGGRRTSLADRLSWLLLGSGLVMALTAGGLQLVGWVQAATYRQAGVRAPWSTPAVDALPGRPSLPGSAVSATALADAEGEQLPEPAPPDVAAGRSAGVQTGPAAALAPPRRLRIPSIGVDTAVKDLGIDDRGEWELPNLEVGWYRHTALPGSAGNAVLVGHLDDAWGLPRVFARLRSVRPGDTIEVDSASADGALPRLLRYVVSETRLVPFTAVYVMDQTADPRLTLFTCGRAWDFLHGQYSHRQVVVARPLETVGS